MVVWVVSGSIDQSSVQSVSVIVLYEEKKPQTKNYILGSEDMVGTYVIPRPSEKERLLSQVLALAIHGQGRFSRAGDSDLETTQALPNNAGRKPRKQACGTSHLSSFTL